MAAPAPEVKRERTRRSKWDAAPPSALQPPQATPTATVAVPVPVPVPVTSIAVPTLMAGTLVLPGVKTPEQAKAELQALLQQKGGGLSSGGVNRSNASPAAKAPVFERDVDINDSTARMQLTKRQTHDLILQKTGSSVSVRGRFVPKGQAPPPGERPLYLSVTAPDANGLEEAVKLLEDIMRPRTAPPGAAGRGRGLPLAGGRGLPLPVPGSGGTNAYGYPAYGYAAATLPPPPPPPPPLPPISSILTGDELKVYVGVEASAAAAIAFPLIDKLNGPDGLYLKHIEGTANVRASVQGRGSSAATATHADGLHISILTTDAAGRHGAQALAENLIDTVRKEFLIAQLPPPTAYYPPAPAPGYAQYGAMPPPPPPAAFGATPYIPYQQMQPQAYVPPPAPILPPGLESAVLNALAPPQPPKPPVPTYSAAPPPLAPVVPPPQQPTPPKPTAPNSPPQPSLSALRKRVTDSNKLVAYGDDEDDTPTRGTAVPPPLPAADAAAQNEIAARIEQITSKRLAAQRAGLSASTGSAASKKRSHDASGGDGSGGGSGSGGGEFAPDSDEDDSAPTAHARKLKHARTGSVAAAPQSAGPAFWQSSFAKASPLAHTQSNAASAVSPPTAAQRSANNNGAATKNPIDRFML